MIRPKKYRFVVVVIACCLLLSSAQAQHSLQLYNFRNVAQSGLLNPATKIQSNFTLGVYGMGNAQMPNINLADVFAANSSRIESIESIINGHQNSLKDLSFQGKAGVFLGFRFRKKNYISLGAYADGELETNVPDDLLRLLYNGSLPYVGKTLNIAPQISGSANIVYHIGFARELTKDFSVGIRAKLISGIQNFSTQNSTMLLSIRDDDPLTKYTYSLSSNYDVHFTNSAVVFGNKSVNDLTSDLFSNGINGFGIDLGFDYKINKKWAISASVLDLGSMNWTKDAGSLQKKVTNQSINGIIIESVSAINSSTSYLSNRLDTLVRDVNFDTTYNSYSTRLNSKFYIGTEYSFSPVTKASSTFYGRFSTLGFDYAFGIAISQKLWSILDAKLGWSAYDNSFDNLGAGVSINLGYFQVYAMAENLLSAFRYDQAHTLNLNLGVNFNFGLNLDKDKDGVPNRKDKCVNIPGLEMFDGCPDTDRDSVPDYKDSCRLDSGAVINKGCPLNLDRDGDSVLNQNDSCPDIKGSKTAFGCPDKDEDGVPDYQDSCVNIAGPAFSHGCPDDDNDGIPNKDDSCKSLAGNTIFHGCPTEEKLIAARFDRDGDETPDSLDRCPDISGEPLLYGCPDYDSDGIPDYQDSCIELVGEIEFNGCPDTDGDKVPDYIDDCITLSGSPENRGCPLSVGDRKLVVGNTKTRKKGGVNTEESSNEKNTTLRNIPLDPTQSKVLVEAYKNLQFKFQSASIVETSYPVLDDLATLLSSKPNASVVLIGHTDNVGDELINQVLSYRRAVSVRNYLRTKGVTNKMELFGFGENRPIADNNTPQGRTRNRRVEIGILEE